MTSTTLATQTTGIETTTLARDEYGALHLSACLNEAARKELKEMVQRACKRELFAKDEVVEATDKYFEVVKHSMMDVLMERGRVRSFVIQVRRFSRNKKGYTRIEKTYMMVRKSGRELLAEAIDGRTCAKRAKNSTKLGQLVRHFQGVEILACKPPVVEVSQGYKVLARGADDTLVSVFDDSRYKRMTWRSQQARGEHGGGFYFYVSRDEALAAVKTNVVFNEEWTQGKQLVLCRVEVSGREVAYQDGKWAASRLRVIEVLENLNT
jgi:hypothetical protein